MKKYAVLAMISAVVGCADPAPEDALTGYDYVALKTAEDRSDELDCACFHDLYGHADWTSCYAARATQYTSTEELCVIEAGRAFPKFQDEISCQASAMARKASCYQGFTSFCSTSGFDSCDSTYDLEISYCDDPCEGGSSKCVVERAQMLTAFQACTQ